MLTCYVCHPKGKHHTGAYIVSAGGEGSEIRSKKKTYKLVSILRKRENGAKDWAFFFIFEEDDNLYECSPSFPLSGGQPSAKLNGRKIMAPKALRLFSDPDVLIKVR